MALNFPNLPYVGQIYVGPNGVAYTFDGVKWVGGTNGVNYQTSQLIVLNSQPSTSSNSGALQVVGGAGIGGNLYVGGTIYSNGYAISTGTNGGGPIASGTGTTTTFVISNITNASNSTNTGALQVAGGAGIALDAWIGGNINLPTGTLNVQGASISSATLATIALLAQNIQTGGTNSQTVYIIAGVESTSTTTGDLVTTGGIGIGKSGWFGNTLHVKSTASSISTSTGSALMVSGGISAGGNINFGGNLYQNGVLFAGGGVTSITAGTGTAISSSTGAITIWTTGTGGSSGVTSITAGTGTAISGSSGAITIWNTSGSGGTNNRSTASVTVNSLSGLSAVTATIVAYAGYALYSIAVSTGAWITLYSSTATMRADFSRSITSDPTPGSGVIAEAITTQSATTLFTPAIIGFSSETIPTTNIPVKIYNNTAASANITVTLTVLKMEG